jgi:hypothetical protein
VQAAGTLDSDRVAAIIARHLGTDDERIETIRRIAASIE